MAGPLFLIYYGRLQPFLFPGTGIFSVAKKLLVDQLIWAPFMTSFIFFTITLLEGNRA